MTERKKRRRWTASEKLRIVLAGMESGVDISELCRREGVSPTMYYGWKKKLLSSATKVFDDKPAKEKARQEQSEKEMARLKDVIAEITSENLELKKTFSG